MLCKQSTPDLHSCTPSTDAGFCALLQVLQIAMSFLAPQTAGGLGLVVVLIDH
jgi:hypothetical protein